jgi:uncharacterized protein with NAD-binding domain and iron-sulfur cluster
VGKTKVAILGGGMGSIATAFSLTATTELRAKYEVTIYQLGWRIGGKGASGRNQQCVDRIEEHGLHIWFGFYDNAFRMMSDCYRELGRAPGRPLATLEDAFKPCDNFVLYENYKGRWIGRAFHAPRNDQQPGGEHPLPGFAQMAENALSWALSLWAERPPHIAAVAPGVSPLFDVIENIANFHVSLSNSPLAEPALSQH